VAQASQFSPELAQGLLQHARALLGPAKIWAADGDPSIILEQIDYEHLLARQQGGDRPEARRDDLWRAIVLSIASGQTAAFDDVKVAQLLATALALEGQASDRLATIFNTIAPDDARKRRVLTLTRSMLSETDFGRVLVNSWERDGRGDHIRAVVEAVDPAGLGIDSLTYL
jgi:hypothetical protein